MTEYCITITLKDVTEGDVIGVAQQIWDAHAADLDAAKGDFEIGVSHDGLTLEWEPQ